MRLVRQSLWLLLALLLLHPSTAQVKVACIGDSVTEGLGLQDPENEAYPAQLQEMLGADYEVMNFGNSGATLLKAGHKPYYNLPEFEQALKYDADIAVIHLGLNDTDPRNFPHYRDRFVPDYVWLIDTLRHQHPDLDIYVCSMTPIFTGHARFTSSTYEWHQLLQKEIDKVVKATGVKFIDLFEAFRHRPELITDAPTLHPNKAGAKLLAETVYQHITGDFGGLSVAPTWGSNMVLQKNTFATLSGLADRDTEIQVTWRGQTYSDTAGVDGKWEVALPTGAATKSPQTLLVSTSEINYQFDNLLVGQVWLASGQSNMAWELQQVEGGGALLQERGHNSSLRLLRLEPLAETDNISWSEETLQRANELDFFHGEWKVSTPEAASNFSAIGYAFAEELQRELDEPVGVIQLAVGGSPLISWVSRHAMLEDPRYHGAFVRWRQSDFVMRWCRERANTNLALTDDPFQRHPYEPAFNQEAGLRLLEGMPIAGILWYQGESDAENAELHNRLFPLFVKDLRGEFGAELPIFTVQLSSIERPSWPRFRDAQLQLTRELPGVYLAVSHDYGHPTDVHPRQKLPIAHRLAKQALRYTYGHEDLIAAAPMPQKVAKDKQGRWTVFFDKMESHLVTSDGQSVRGMVGITLSGEVLPLKAWVCDGCKEHLHFEMPEGEELTHVAYAWDAYTTEGNVMMKEGQPMPTFILPIIKN